MKYAIIIPDGAADEPLAALGGRTPLEAAHIPHMDAIASAGRLGLARTIPDGFESGSDVAIMSLLGYDPSIYHSGRAPLEAAAQRIPMAPTDWVFRCNLVSIRDGVMKDHSAGGISSEEGRALITSLAAKLNLPGWELHCGVSYRNLMLYRGKDELKPVLAPPHEIPDQPINTHLPRGQGADVLQRIIDLSAKVFADHPVNVARRALGKNPATHVWFWGAGHAPTMPTFVERYGVGPGCMITAVDLLRGLGVLMGWKAIDVPGMTSYHDTNYAGQGAATAAALDQYNVVLCHVEAPDEASHQADHKTKIASIEAIDTHIVGPVLRKLRSFPRWRILVMPDHPTNVATRKHGYAPTLFGIAGTGVAPMGIKAYSESQAAGGGLRVDKGHELMGLFLKR